MSTLFATAVWLATGLVLASALVDDGERDELETVALAGGLGLCAVTGAVLLGLSPGWLIVVLLVALVVLLPVALYRLHGGRLPAGLERRVARRIARARGDADPGRAGNGKAAPADGAGAGWATAGRWLVLGLVVLVAVAGFFRFRHLGYSELQGDEARAALMAWQLGASGDPEVLLAHKKGPLEVLMPAAAIARSDQREGAARLPFAVAGFLGVLAAFALGRRLWGVRAGWLAAMLLAVDGYLIAFSRIVQYQSLVFLFSVLAVWCAWRFNRRAEHADRYLALAGLFIGLGTWAHYEMVFAVPPVGWLVLARGREEGWTPGEWLQRLALPVVLAAGVTAAFYVPFVRHPQFAATSAYLVERRIGGGLYNKLGDYFHRASFYNASYYVLTMGLVLTAVVAERLRAAFGRRGTAAAVAWLAALAALVARPGWFEVRPDLSLAVLVFLPVLVALFFAPRLDTRWRAVLLWLAGPFFAASFFVTKPHTHFYTMMPAWALLAGWGLDRALGAAERRLGQQRARTAAGLVGVALLAVFALHQYVVFIRHTPEYKRVWPEARLPGYWTPFGDELPRGGYFGFPYRAGWSEVRRLFADGTLAGDFDSNEELLVTGWYTLGAPRCPEQPRYYLVAWRPQDDEPIPREAIERDYHLAATVRVNGAEKLWVYGREPPHEAVVLDDDGGGLLSVDRADSSWSEVVLPVSQALERRLPITALDARFEGGARLVGLDAPLLAGDGDADELVHVESGDALELTLLWAADAPVEGDLSVFVHVVDAAGRTVAQHDGWPDCGRAPTSAWAPGGTVFDPHVIVLPSDVAAGDYTVRAGLYDPATGARRAVLDAAGAPAGDAVTLGRLTVGGAAP